MIETATEIRVELANEPGTLGEATTALGNAGINILGISLEAEGTSGTARFVTDEPEMATTELETIGLAPSQRDLVLASAPNEPGALGRMATQLGDSGVNIETVFPVFDPSNPTPTIAFAVDEVNSARKALET